MNTLYAIRLKYLRFVVVLVGVILLLHPSKVTLANPPPPNSKDDGNAGPVTVSANSLVDTLTSSGGALISCGASSEDDWTTTSGSFQVIRECTLSVPQSGRVFISADGSVGRQDGKYEARFRIGIDDTAGDSDIDRWVNVYNDAGDGTDKSVALSVLKSVTPGTHTFYFLGLRYSGTGTVFVYDPTLTVIAPGARVHLPLALKHD